MSNWTATRFQTYKCWFLFFASISWGSTLLHTHFIVKRRYGKLKSEMGLCVRFVCIFLFNFLKPEAPGFAALSPPKLKTGGCHCVCPRRPLRWPTQDPGPWDPGSTLSCSLPTVFEGKFRCLLASSSPRLRRVHRCAQSGGYYAARTYFCAAHTALWQ